MIILAVNSSENGFFDYIVNPIALSGNEPPSRISKYYPEMMNQVEKYKRQGHFNAGQLWPYIPKQEGWAKILNMPVRQHVKKPIDPKILEDSIQNLAETYEKRGISFIWMPQFGFEEPGAPDWETWTKPMLVHYFAQTSLNAFVQEHRS